MLSPFIESINTGDDIPSKILLGAAENSTKERFQVLVELEENNHHADVVYLLGGKRELWIDHEPITTKFIIERLVKASGITEQEAETEVQKAIEEFFPDKNNITAKRNSIVKFFKSKGISWPTEAEIMKNLSLAYSELSSTTFILIDAPMKINDKGQLVRPDTLDTYNQLWEDYGEIISFKAKEQPSHKFPLSIVTTQPFGIYQYTQALTAFYNKPVEIKVVAKRIKNSATMNIATAFDSLARTIYAGKNIVLKKLDALNKDPIKSKEEL